MLLCFTGFNTIKHNNDYFPKIDYHIAVDKY